MTNKLFFTFLSILLMAGAGLAQTASFTFQGKLNDSAVAANGTYQFQFKLFDAGGNQVGQTLADIPATVTNGIFTVNLDFGAESFDGSLRSLEIGVRLSGGGQNYTVLNPRQPIASTPYAVRSLNANAATTAVNSQNLGGLPAAQYVQTNDARMSDAREPVPGSASYIQNSQVQQTGAANFNISGEGRANIFNAATQFNINGTRVLSMPGDFNLFAGINSGAGNSSGYSNSFFGAFAGQKNTAGGFNSFFGRNAGQNNLDGNRNSFFGVNAGLKNESGAENSFFGMESGLNNSTGNSNAFFGAYAGKSNNSGGSNSFFGREAGENNTTGDFNAFFGRNAGKANQTGTLLAFFGTNAGLKNVSGEANAFFGGEAGMENTDGDFNSFFGFTAGKNNSLGFNNSFFGAFSGRGNSSGANNAFFGSNAGLSSNGSLNSFYGSAAGLNNQAGSNNSFFGGSSGVNNTSGVYNTFIGASAGKDNLTGKNNTFVGALSGLGVNSSPTGDNNTAVGYNTSFAPGVSNAVAIGANVSVSNSNEIRIGGFGQFVSVPKLSTSGEIFANGLEIGANLLTVGPGSINLGTQTSATNITASGFVKAESVKANLTSSGNNNLCFRYEGTYGVLATCSSSLRYKTNVENFNGGLELVKRLRPVTFNWKADGTRDVGFIAEEVNQVEPLFNNYNPNGEIEGVKYAQITTALVNSVKEQQAQIEQQTAENQKLQEQLKQQQAQIDALKALVCQSNPTAGVCAAPEKK
jgi:hypothetical protein